MCGERSKMRMAMMNNNVLIHNSIIRIDIITINSLSVNYAIKVITMQELYKSLTVCHGNNY